MTLATNPTPLLDYIQSNLMDWVYASHGKVKHAPMVDVNDPSMQNFPNYRPTNRGDFDPARRLPKDEAIEFELIQIQGRLRRYIVVDIDHPDAFDRAYDFVCPPNLALINPQNGHGHLVWFLDGSHITFPKPGDSYSRAAWWLKLITQAINHEIGGDPDYTGMMVKNPWHQKWRVCALHDRKYTLQQFSDRLDLAAANKAQNARRKKVDNTGYGRRSSLFRSMSHWGHANFDRCHSRDALQHACLDEATRINATFQMPLSPSHIRSVAKSVARGVWRYRRSCKSKSKPKRKVGGKDIGAARVDPSLDQPEKQRLGQSYACGVKVEKSIQVLRAAYDRLKSTGAKITQRILAGLTGLSLSCVRDHWVMLTGKAGHYASRIVRPVIDSVTCVISRIGGSIRSTLSTGKAGRTRLLKPHTERALPDDITPDELEFWEKHTTATGEWVTIDQVRRLRADKIAADIEQKKKKQKPTIGITRGRPEACGLMDVWVGNHRYRLPHSWSDGMIWSHHRTGNTFGYDLDKIAA